MPSDEMPFGGGLPDLKDEIDTEVEEEDTDLPSLSDHKESPQPNPLEIGLNAADHKVKVNPPIKIKIKMPLVSLSFYKLTAQNKREAAAEKRKAAAEKRKAEQIETTVKPKRQAAAEKHKAATDKRKAAKAAAAEMKAPSKEANTGKKAGKKANTG
ncbi:uncharacterized protein MELLADRAFT_85865 [Melampsora larici-populina 98AG31]|uniref:Uncharacterized protein n=1 Tax=Melampsora larici-populina (strain 98AG31 / pathotype 3-4-7) TaxID=747676 RepID=F4SDF3_MELLP|nr:uncharacterized protein MELLADRAFT_85865 [Melampsora larici-populina 98AG31]EGF97324.1 hypothetical protein MELLADRAFT_85865 [Melampsora larici-populina 98AG31]